MQLGTESVRRKSRSVIAALVGVLVVWAVALILRGQEESPSPDSNSTQPKITWSENHIQAAFPPGGSATKAVAFSSSLPVENLVIEPVPSLAPLLRIEPNTFTNVPADQNQSVRLLFSVPQGAAFGTNEGTVHVRIGSQTLPQTLKVSVWVVDIRSLETSLPGMVRGSPIIVIGNVVAVSSTVNSPKPPWERWKYVTLTPTRVLKGSLSANTLVFSSYVGVAVSSPSFQEGETVLLMLGERNPLDTLSPAIFSLTGSADSVYHIRDDPASGTLAVIDEAWNGSEGMDKRAPEFKAFLEKSERREVTLDELLVAMGFSP